MSKEKLQEIEDEYFKNVDEKIDSVNTFVEELMQLAYNQAIDDASKSAKIIKTGNSGSYFDASIDRESILKLKIKLKIK